MPLSSPSIPWTQDRHPRADRDERTSPDDASAEANPCRCSECAGDDRCKDSRDWVFDHADLCDKSARLVAITILADPLPVRYVAMKCPLTEPKRAGEPDVTPDSGFG